MLRFLRARKGVAASVFKYIFAVVAGAIILIFFVRFAMDMTDTQKSVSNAELGFMIDESLNALTVSEDQSEPIPGDPWPSPVMLSFGKGPTCGKLSSGSYNFNIHKVVFSPLKIDGNQIFAWTQSWYYPFEVDNFFYLSNKNSKYYLVYPSGEVADFVRGLDSQVTPAERHNEHFPKSFEVESISSDQVNARLAYASGKYSFVKFAFFKTNPPLGFKGNYVVIDYVDCEPDRDDDDCHGSLTFSSGKSFFAGKPMLYGAVLAEDFESYQCQLGRIYKRLGIILSLYSEKADLLYDKDMLDFFNDCSYDLIKSANLDAFNLEVDSAKGNPSYGNHVRFDFFKDIIVESNNKLGGKSACTILF
ncbi:MAG: hypothetical protein ABIH63_00800 [archaeon]